MLTIIFISLVIAVIQSKSIKSTKIDVFDVNATDIPSVIIFALHGLLNKLDIKFRICFCISAIYFVLVGVCIKLFFSFEIYFYIADIVYISIFVFFAFVAIMAHLVGSVKKDLRETIFGFMPVTNLLFGLILLCIVADIDFLRVELTYVIISCLMVVGIVACVVIRIVTKRKNDIKSEVI